MNTVMTMDEAHESMRQMRQVFDVVRLLEAETVQKINENKKHPEGVDPCFAFWRKSHPCENCVSFKALEAKSKKVKMEFIDSVLYQVVAKYVEIDGKAYVMEMINCLDDDVMLDSEGRDRLLRKLSGYDDELYIDALTGISNRRYFEDQIRKMKASAGVAMIDLDDFKIYNDTFGHRVGDVVLKTAAKVIREGIRKSDIIIRYGGDEFLLVMPDISAEVFAEKLKQIRKNISEAKVPGYSRIHLTVSIGGTLSSGDTVEDAIIRADQYMYQAKLRKNMVVTTDVVSDGNLEEHESSRFRQKILIIDDSEFNRAILAEVLGGEFDILEAENGKEGLEVLEQYERDISLVLLDIIMPVMDGFEVLGEMVNRNWIDDIPVIMISSEDSENIIRRAYEMGVSDYINRPFDAQVVYRRVYNTIKLYAKQRRLIQLVTDQVYEKQKNSQIMIGILSQIMGYRNGESGQHILRINLITDILLDELARKTDRYNLSWSRRSVIIIASALHDIGKIGISGTILNKPESLTAEEQQIIRAHTLIGAALLKNLELYQNEELVKTAYEICRWHHERYDGNGYPDGLKGEEIPIAAQVVSLADAYDILVSKRAYKEAIPHREAVKKILEGESGIFNPVLLECLVNAQGRIQRELGSQIISYMKFDCCPRISNFVEK
ncbi:diguanylate cyclase [Blautia sp. MSJ-9]|uniref:diguanylate cyclase n=1 Tax=Blautia sp. MSJ-9 TaxID=2841511 RepID=UPI001C0F3E25|nr:diguanylate cyclase [Blautia sp. MSJ-9]MBU5680575.1 diguanylate cyclase [Blautia sp. MSJ-9]